MNGRKIGTIKEEPRFLLFWTYEDHAYKLVHQSPLMNSWTDVKHLLTQEPYRGYNSYLCLQTCIPKDYANPFLDGPREMIHKETLERYLEQENE